MSRYVKDGLFPLAPLVEADWVRPQHGFDGLPVTELGVQQEELMRLGPLGLLNLPIKA